MSLLDIWTRWHNLPPWMREREREKIHWWPFNDRTDRVSWAIFQPSYFVLFDSELSGASDKSEKDRYTRNVYTRGIYRDGAPIERKRSKRRENHYTRESVGTSRRLDDTCRAACASKNKPHRIFSGRRTMAMARSRVVDPSRRTRLLYGDTGRRNRILTWRDARRWTISY